MNKILYLAISLIMLGCGKGSLDISEARYEPKIVIEGYLYPNQKVQNIMITRNWKLNENIDVTSLIITDASVNITDVENNKTLTLIYNPIKRSYEYLGNDLVIQYGNSYRLEVSAIIDGKSLNAVSTTTVPGQGLLIDNKFIDSLSYSKEAFAGDDSKLIQSAFRPATNCSFYAVSVTAMESVLDNYIWESAFRKRDTAYVKKNIEQLKLRSTFITNVKPGAEKSEFKLPWIMMQFYGKHRVILYAADENMKNYFLTHKSVQEFDGNFHEPKFNITGDGIGVFGSAAIDTAYFKVLK